MYLKRELSKLVFSTRNFEIQFKVSVQNLKSQLELSVFRVKIEL